VRRVLVVLFVIGSTLVPAAHGGSQEAPGVLLIMDASGSMNRDSGNGNTLLDEAKDALREVVRRLPPDTNIGLRVYGHTAASNDPKTVGCVDTELIIPVGPIDRDAMIEAIDEFAASGWTPIGTSLEQAVDDLGGAGGTIILVSDGEDTCAPPDPCEVAQQLAADGYITAIHTVGLALQDEAAIDQLQCVADAAGGTFTDVESVEFLLESLSGVVTDVIEGPEVPYVLGSLLRENAPLLSWERWDGSVDWFNAFASGAIQTGETRWVAVDIPLDGQQLSANAVIGWQPEAGIEEYIEVRIFDEDGIEVGVPHEVAGLVVEAPQRLYLANADDWFPLSSDWQPSAWAVTDPPSMFPSWEPFEEFFEPTVARFEAAGFNGGIYHLWKRWEPRQPFAEGRYYIGVTWESEREDVTELQIGVVAYRAGDEDDDWRGNRPRLPVVIDDRTSSPFGLVAEPWVGGSSDRMMGVPSRAVEVWAALEPPEPYRTTIDLTAGEVLAIGTDVEFAGDWSGVSFEIDVSHANGPAIQRAFEAEESWLGAYMSYAVVEATWDGEYTVLITANMDGGLTINPAVAAAFFVLPQLDVTGDSDGSLEGGPADGLWQWLILTLIGVAASLGVLRWRWRKAVGGRDG